MRIEPMTGALGAEILDIDLSVPLAPDAFVAVRCALFDYQVIVFRDQRLTLDQHKNFARQFGPLHIHPYILAKPLDGHPEVLRVVKEKDDHRVFGEKWHSDVTFLTRPVLGSVLYAIDTPRRGGDTLFANMYAAHDALSAAMRTMLDGLTAIHETPVPEVDPATGRPFEPLRLVNRSGEHPVLFVHPETGRKLLYVNSTYTTHFKGMTVEESRPLLEYLFQHATQAAFTCRVRWAPGTVTFWDNRSTQHLPINDYHGERREMHRVTVET
ncbi:TauD/TfdA dioxygenase family protein [Paraburkholderia sp.]|uniref:TauD/TfdA dioxygenase family protein n=1 Tax=Paraburkholderia sp. TaxID=1926495 RepID=UPI002F423929